MKEEAEFLLLLNRTLFQPICGIFSELVCSLNDKTSPSNTPNPLFKPNSKLSENKS